MQKPCPCGLGVGRCGVHFFFHRTFPTPPPCIVVGGSVTRCQAPHSNAMVHDSLQQLHGDLACVCVSCACGRQQSAGRVGNPFVWPGGVVGRPRIHGAPVK